ncbi:MAG: UDP-N-acetylmuramate--L-alanine ligase, partial [Halothiobacillus sp.]
AEAGWDPTYVIGGKLLSSSSNARLGRGEYLVAEADESDASFLHLQPHVAIVTNIDADHLETYQGNFERLVDHFVEFLHNLPFYGLAVLCADDPVVMSIVARVGRQVLTYGINQPADVQATEVRAAGFGSQFVVRLPNASAFECHLSMPGRHNVLNALAAITVANDLGVPIAAIQNALASFQGVGRRLERRGSLFINGQTLPLVDDYGHHPRELEATLQAVRAAWPATRLVVIFQPHRFSRTRDLFEDFVRVLSTVDLLILLDVYAAGEAPIAGADGRSLVRAIRNRGQVEPIFANDTDEVPQLLHDLLCNTNPTATLVLTLGAGNVGGLPALLQAKYGVTHD